MTAIDYYGPAPPKPGQTVELHPGLFWARMQLPFKPDTVNVWLLRDQSRWTIIDAGFDWAPARDDWRAILDDLDIRTVERLVMTHAHFDHVSLAGWLCDQTGAQFHLAQSELVYMQFLRSDWDIEAFKLYFRMAGCPEEMIGEFAQWKAWAQQALAIIPEICEPVYEGGRLRMAGRDWQVMSSGGHSRGQRAFWCERDGILIGGDIVLPRIYSTIGVCSDALAANPIGDALAGWQKLNALPADTIVLPSHGAQFKGLKSRLDQLVAECSRRTERLKRACSMRELSVFEALSEMYGDRLPSSVRIAILEVQAHLNFLETEGVVTSSIFADGVRRYRTAP